MLAPQRSSILLHHSIGAYTHTVCYMQAAGSRIGNIVEGATGLTLAFAVGFWYSWLLTILLMAVVPLYIFSGWVHVWASKGFAGLQSGAFKDASEVSNFL